MQISKIRWTVEVFNKLAGFLFFFFLYIYWMEFAHDDMMTSKGTLSEPHRDPVCVQGHCVCGRCLILSNISLFCFWGCIFWHFVFFLPPYILDCILSFQLPRLQSVHCSSTHERTDALSHGSAVELMEDELIMDVLRKRAEKTDVSTDSYPIPSFHL